MSQFKVKQKVHFTGRVRTGTGRITAVRPTARGDFYDIKPDEKGAKPISLKAGQLKLA